MRRRRAEVLRPQDAACLCHRRGSPPASHSHPLKKAPDHVARCLIVCHGIAGRVYCMNAAPPT
jgi:hypothetical protein